MGKSILTLFKSSCTNIDQYLPLFHSDIKYTMGSYSKLITVILDISFQVQAIINEVRVKIFSSIINYFILLYNEFSLQNNVEKMIKIILTINYEDFHLIKQNFIIFS